MSFGSEMRDVKRSVRNLSRGSRAESPDVKDALSVFDSIFAHGPRGGYAVCETGQRARRIKLERFAKNAKDFVKKSDRLFLADQQIAAHPHLSGMTASQLIAAQDKLLAMKMPGKARLKALQEEYGSVGAREILRKEGEIKRLNERLSKIHSYTEYKKTHIDKLHDVYGYNAENVLNDEVNDKIESIRDPEAYHKRKIREEYGMYADNILDAERDALKERGERTARSMKARQKWAYKHDVEMSDYERDLFDSKKEYGASRGEDALRNNILKELPPFFKNSRMSTKDLHAMAKNIRNFSKIPLVGQVIKNPVAAGIGAAMWLANTSISGEREGNKKAVEWQNIAGVWGKPSNNFIKAAKDAGLSGVSIDKKYAALASRFYDPEVLTALAGMPASPEKGMMMKQLGLDEDDMRIIDALGGAQSDDARKKNRHISEAQTVREQGLRRGTSVWTKLESLKYRIPIFGEWFMNDDAEMYELMEETYKRFGREYKGSDSYRDIQDLVYQESLRMGEYDLSRSNNPPPSGTLTPSTTGGTNVQVHGNIIIENAENAKDVADGIRDYSDKQTSRLRAATSHDPKGQ